MRGGAAGKAFEQRVKEFSKGHAAEAWHRHRDDQGRAGAVARRADLGRLDQGRAEFRKR